VKRGLTAAAALLAPPLLAGAVSCIPDLVFPAPDAGITAPICGDGIVDPDRGEECDPGNLAGTPACSKDCKVICLPPRVLSSVTKHCYWKASDAVSDALVAVQTCALQGGHVVTYGSAEELDDAPDVARAHWVGLKYEQDADAYKSAVPEEPGWAGSRCTGCYANTDNKNEVLFPKPPGLPPGVFQCVVAPAKGEGRWIQIPCTGSTQTPALICESEPQGAGARPCEGGVCAQVHATRKKYLFVPTPVSQEEAARRCGERKMQLVMFDSNEERAQLVRALLPQVQGGTLVFWIGLSRGLLPDAGSASAFFWDDGVSLAGSSRPLPWGNNQPLSASEKVRAFVVAGGGGYDTQLSHVDSASTPRPFVCEGR
jgi:cysteine-rich repeat protein